MRSVPLRVLIALVALVALVSGIFHSLGEPERRRARYAAITEQHRQWRMVGYQEVTHVSDEPVERHYRMTNKYSEATAHPMDPVPPDPPQGDDWRERVRRVQEDRQAELCRHAAGDFSGAPIELQPKEDGWHAACFSPLAGSPTAGGQSGPDHRAENGDPPDPTTTPPPGAGSAPGRPGIRGSPGWAGRQEGEDWVASPDDPAEGRVDDRRFHGVLRVEGFGPEVILRLLPGVRQSSEQKRTLRRADSTFLQRPSGPLIACTFSVRKAYFTNKSFSMAPHLTTAACIAYDMCR